MANLTANVPPGAGDLKKSEKSVKIQLWIGRVLTGLVVLALLPGGAMKLAHAPTFVEQWTGRLGMPGSLLTGVGILELACLAIYLMPRTQVAGAVLLTGYFGGAIVTHLRVGEPFVVPLLLGGIVWLSLYLRDPRARAIVQPTA